MKRRVYKRYRKAKRGGQHYTIGKNTVSLMAKNISEQSNVPLDLATLQAESGVIDVKIKMLKHPEAVNDVSEALKKRENFIIGVNNMKPRDKATIGRDYDRELKKVSRIIKTKDM